MVLQRAFFKYFYQDKQLLEILYIPAHSRFNPMNSYYLKVISVLILDVTMNTFIL